MRLKTKLVLAAMAVTFAMVTALSMLFLGELLRQRIDQTATDNDVLAHQVLLMTRQAVEVSLAGDPPSDGGEVALRAAVRGGLRQYQPLTDTMNAIIRYSATAQDVRVTDADGVTLTGTDPDTLDENVRGRPSLRSLREGSIPHQVQQMVGRPQVFDVALPLDRNGVPFVIVHLGVRSSFLRAAFEPRFRSAVWSALLSALLAMLAAALLASAALRPMERVSEQLERLTRPGAPDGALTALPGPPVEGDAVVRVNQTIDRLGRQIRTTEAEYTALQANLNQMLDTLRDGVMLFTADRRAAMISDAVAHFLELPPGLGYDSLIGKSLGDIFVRQSALGAAVLHAFESPSPVEAENVQLEDGRRIQLSVDRIRHGHGNGEMGTLLTLRDTDSAIKLEQELEVSRRLMAIGRLTAGVGHEVKNPINAMVLHLELLRAKLAGAEGDAVRGAQRHVDILSGEMQRLDRVVQTLADFTRPVELHLAEHDLRHIVGAVVDLTGAEMTENGVRVEIDAPPVPLPVRVDDDLLRQAILNLLLNAMQAMPGGGLIRIVLRREGFDAAVQVIDQGEGIPPELLPRIFDLYFTTKPSGTGIGLAMTYRVLQMHGGALEVRSSTTSNRDVASPGTTFELRLPLSPSATFDVRENGRVTLTQPILERRA